MSEVFDAVNDDYTEFSDPEHFDLVSQGFMDTFDGTEGLRTTYTKAQEYLFSCLEAGDHLSYQERVSGMEGVLSAIGDGFKSAWEYIKALFKRAWNFFFDSGEGSIEDKAEKTEKKVEKNEETLKALASSGKSEKQVETIRKKVKEKAKKIMDNPKASSGDKAKAHDIAKKIDEGNVKSLSQKESEARVLCEKMGALNKDEREKLIKKIGETEQIRRKYVQYVEKDHSGQIGTSRFQSMYKVFNDTLKQGVFHTPMGDLIKVDSVTSISTAVQTQSKIKDAVEKHKKFANYIKSEKNDFQQEIKELEDAIGKTGKGSNQGEVLGETFKSKGELKKRLESANKALRIVNATAGFQSKVLEAMEKLSDSVVHIFGDYSESLTA